MSDAIELLKKVIDANGLFGDLKEEIEAYLATETKPDYWHVVDKEGNSIYSASHKQACIDHINDALISDHWDSDVGLWKVEPLYAEPQERKPLSDDEILSMAEGNSYPRSIRKIIDFARAIEKAHGIW